MDMARFLSQYKNEKRVLLRQMATRFAEAQGAESRDAFENYRQEQSMVHKGLQFVSPIDTLTAKKGDAVEIVGELLDVNIGAYDRRGVARTVQYTQEHRVLFVVRL